MVRTYARDRTSICSCYDKGLDSFPKSSDLQNNLPSVGSTWAQDFFLSSFLVHSSETMLSLG